MKNCTKYKTNDCFMTCKDYARCVILLPIQIYDELKGKMVILENENALLKQNLRVSGYGTML